MQSYVFYGAVFRARSPGLLVTKDLTVLGGRWSCKIWSNQQDVATAINWFMTHTKQSAVQITV